jgi:hypothetical protein
VKWIEEMEQSVEDMDGDQKRKIELNFCIWMLLLTLKMFYIAQITAIIWWTLILLWFYCIRNKSIYNAIIIPRRMVGLANFSCI